MIAPAGPIVVSTPGTIVSAIVNFPAQPNGKVIVCHGVLFQALPTNAGKVYIGTSAMNKSTFVELFAILAIPTTNLIPSFSAALTITPNGLNLNQFYVDADSPGDGVILTYLQT